MSLDRSPPPPIPTGLAGRCPRCGQGRLFKGFLKIRPTCERCGLDFAFADTADGPAFFVMSFVGILVVGLALWVELTWEPRIWVHLVLWGPLATVLCLVMVRPLKGMMAALQYAHRAEEGRFRR